MDLKTLTRKPLFWILFVCFTLLCLFYSLTNFREAFSILNVEITMDRGTALSKAASLMKTFTFGPPEYEQAVAV